MMRWSIVNDEEAVKKGRKKRIVETGERWERGVGWSQVVALIEIAKQPVHMEWTEAKREQIIQQMMARMDRNRLRRRVRRAVAAGLAAAALVALVLGLTGVGGDWLRPPFRLASQVVSQRLFAQ
jgi:hypothetical protein